MNADPRFARSQIARCLAALEALGLTAAARRRCRRASGARARSAGKHDRGLLERASQFEEGGAYLDSVRLKMAPREIGLRALAAVLTRVSGEAYRPRFERLERLFDSIRDGTLGGGATLHGCIVAPAPRHLAAFGTGTLWSSNAKKTRRANTRKLTLPKVKRTNSSKQRQSD